MRSLLVLAVALLFFASDAAAQIGSALLLFQNIDPVPRSRAMGEVGVLLHGEAGVAALNPAAIASPHRLQLEAGHNPWLADSYPDTRLSGVNVAYGRQAWALAYQFKRLDFNVPSTRWSGEPGEFSRDNIAHKLAGALDATSHLRAGFALNYIYSQITGPDLGDQVVEPIREITFDVGLHYTRTFEYELYTLTPLAGWSLTDIGGTVDMRSGSAASLPTMMRGGLGLDVASNDVWANRPAIRLGLYGGASKWVVGTDDDGEPYGALEALMKTWQPLDFDLGGGEDDIETLSVFDQLMWHRGLEVSLLDILSFRFGAFDEHEYNGGRDFGTFGWGLDLYYIAINTAVSDFSNQPRQDSPRITTVSVRVPLDGGKAPSNFWPAFIDLIRR